MMKNNQIKTSKKDLLFLAILLTAITIITFWAYNRTEERNALVGNKGHYFLGSITKKVPIGNSGGNSIYFSISCDGEKIEMYELINKPYWLTLSVNDSILTKAIVSDSLEWAVVLDEKQYLVPCLKKYKQPQNGWKELPINECKE